MFRIVRTAISLAVVVVMLWAAFAVDLGGRTFAEHIDAISETQEAEQLIDGTRSKINPALQEARDRVLGEYVEAPTWIPTDAMLAAPPETKPEAIPAATLPPEQQFEPSLPGRRRPVPAESDDDHEPALPGRR